MSKEINDAINRAVEVTGDEDTAFITAAARRTLLNASEMASGSLSQGRLRPMLDEMRSAIDP